VRQLSIVRLAAAHHEFRHNYVVVIYDQVLIDKPQRSWSLVHRLQCEQASYLHPLTLLEADTSSLICEHTRSELSWKYLCCKTFTEAWQLVK
jgi:hypothetical protein